MARVFFIAPYDPETWHRTKNKSENQPSDFRIDPILFGQQMRERWPDAVIRSTVSTTVSNAPVSWVLPPVDNSEGLYGELQADHQTIYLGSGPVLSLVQFTLWFRSFIPSNQRLYMFDSSSFSRITLSDQTSALDIENFVNRTTL